MDGERFVVDNKGLAVAVIHDNELRAQRMRLMLAPAAAPTSLGVLMVPASGPDRARQGCAHRLADLSALRSHELTSLRRLQPWQLIITDLVWDRMRLRTA